MKRALSVAATALVGVLALQGQIISEDEIRWGTRPYMPRETTTLRVQTTLVQVPVVVRDAKGQPVGNLTQEDFQVLDNGKPQTLSNFAIERAPARVRAGTPVPARPESPPIPTPEPTSPPPQSRYVVLFLDDINLSPSEAPPMQGAAEAFIRDGLAAGDNVAILTTSNVVRLDFTADKGKLLEALGRVQTQLVDLRRAAMCRLIGPYHAYLITEFHSVRSEAFDLAVAMCQCKPLPTCITSAAENLLGQAEMASHRTLDALESAIGFLGKAPGRRVLVLCSSGFLTQTLGAAQDKIIASALRSRVVINSLDAKGLNTEVPGGSDPEGPPVVSANGRMMVYADTLRHQQTEIMNDPMAILAEGTGGRFFHNNNDMNLGIQELASQPEVSYTLGFLPTETNPDGKFHNLKVKLVSRQDYTIEARKGYFAPTKEELAEKNAPGERSDRLNREVLASGTVTEIPADVSTQLGKTDSGDPVLKVSVHVDVKDLHYVKRNDRSVDRLVFVTALFDSQGRFLSGAEAAVDLSLKDATRGWLAQQGLDAKLSLRAPPGSYRLREVVEEMGAGKMAALSRPIETK